MAATDPLAFAQEALGCYYSPQRLVEPWCLKHNSARWPCPEAIALAALIEARGREIRADEPCPTCRQVRAIRTRRAQLRAGGAR